jgi:hypothetical protein
VLVFILGVMLAVFVSVLNVYSSVTEAGPNYHPTSYWCDNTNYPEVFYKGNVYYYVDLSSAFIKDQDTSYSGMKTIVCYNMVIVDPESTTTKIKYILIVTGEDGYNIYDWNDKWQLNTGSFGFQLANFNAGRLLMGYFGL